MLRNGPKCTRWETNNICSSRNSSNHTKPVFHVFSYISLVLCLLVYSILVTCMSWTLFKAAVFKRNQPYLVFFLKFLIF